MHWYYKIRGERIFSGSKPATKPTFGYLMISSELDSTINYLTRCSYKYFSKCSTETPITISVNFLQYQSSKATSIWSRPPRRVLLIVWPSMRRMTLWRHSAVSDTKTSTFMSHKTYLGDIFTLGYVTVFAYPLSLFFPWLNITNKAHLVLWMDSFVSVKVLRLYGDSGPNSRP